MKVAFVKGIIDKRLAHKHREENVFIGDLRRAVPGVLDRESVEAIILPSLSEEDRRFFLDYYQPWTTPSGEPAYTLYNIPHQLSARVFHEDGGTESFSASERRTLLRYYSPVPGSDLYLLKAPVTEMEDVVLSDILDPKGLSLTEEERMRLANLLETVPQLVRGDVFHATFRVDPTHPYYFEHPNEHIPGMMALEAGRQFGMACWHRFGNTPFQGVQFILQAFNTRFVDYLELSYPVFLKGELVQVDRGPQGEWNSVLFRVTAFQRGELCIEMEIQGQVISKRSFQRLRAGRLKTDPQHRFFPIETIHHKVSVWDPTKARYFRVKLWDVSMEGLRVEFLDPLEEGAVTPQCEVILYFEDVGFIRSPCAVAWQRREKELHWAGLRFVGMSQEDRSNLQTAIRQYCHVRREREQL